MLSISCLFAGYPGSRQPQPHSEVSQLLPASQAMSAPTAVLLNFLLLCTAMARETSLAVLSVCICVTLITMTSMADNVFQEPIAIAAFTATALPQISGGEKMADFKVTGSYLAASQPSASCWTATVGSEGQVLVVVDGLALY